jgi:hypothetical protein
MPMFDRTFGALVNYYNDIDMLRHQWDNGQFDIYDEIHIVDGPYEYTRHLNVGQEIAVSPFRDTEIGKTIIADPRVKYRYEVWPDEHNKRIEAYKGMESDYIILHDTDEFYQFFENELQNFVEKGFAAGSFYCQNLCLDGVHFAQEYYAVDEMEGLPHKCFIFDRKGVTAEEHLNFLWLVGVQQHEPDRSNQSHTPLAVGYHFTAMRSEQGQTQKYTFYGALFGKEHQMESDANLGRLRAAVASSQINAPDAMTVYLRAQAGYLGVPNPEGDAIFKNRVKCGEYLEDILGKVAAETNLRHQGPLPLLSGLGCYIYVQSGLPAQILKCDNAHLSISCWDYDIDARPRSHGQLAEAAAEYRLDPPTETNVHGRLFFIHPTSRIEGQDIIRATLTDA